MNEGNDADLERYFGAGKESEVIANYKTRHESLRRLIGKFTRCDCKVRRPGFS